MLQARKLAECGTGRSSVQPELTRPDRTPRRRLAGYRLEKRRTTFADAFEGTIRQVCRMSDMFYYYRRVEILTASPHADPDITFELRTTSESVVVRLSFISLTL